MNSDTQQLLSRCAADASVPIEQVEEVYRLLVATGCYSAEVVKEEIRWFYGQLGLDSYYFETTPPRLVSQHIESLYGAKILARNREEKIGLFLETSQESRAMYACREDHATAIEVERRIEHRYPGHRIQSYLTTGTLPGTETRMRIYFVQPAEYPEDCDRREVELERCADTKFLKLATDATKARYRAIIEKTIRRRSLSIEAHARPDRKTTNFLIAHRRGRTHSYFSAISDVIASHGVESVRKYVEQFNNGIELYSIHVDQGVGEETLEAIREDLSLVYVLPHTSLTPLFQRGELSAAEVVYAYCGWKFAHQFLTRYSDEYVTLAAAFKEDPVRLGLLAQLKHRLSKDTFTEDRIYETILSHSTLVKALYSDFEALHFCSDGRKAGDYDAGHNEALSERIRRDVSSLIDQQVLLAFLHFNRHILRTNFYKDNKSALAFRLDPAFLDGLAYPERPFAVYFMIGSEFRGFHVRFRDVARGGIRIIRSVNTQAYTNNNDTLFDENYRLALTQQRKNKDIPEGGSKGAILLTLEHQNKAEVAFKKYVDSLLDVLLPNAEIVDHLNRQETLFLGPDEGTADLMDWASVHARHRGYPYWKAFTTGKSVECGGIPHDLYGMTTMSVHQYVLGILQALGLKEENVTKLQTGGPDGDLGSNEIKISRDKTVGVVDGSGVLFDPQGIDRQELNRLAAGRQMVEHFDRSRLGPQGALVTLDQRNVELPNGEVIDSGFNFRNDFHLNPLGSADFFVPCGGRPDSVHINNVDRLFDSDGAPRFRFVVEGANLFFSQEARLALERAGVVVFKDASANKGGVTSSSLEVFAALALDDAQLGEHMEVHHGRVPAFYEAYVKQVQAKISENAECEFRCLWDARQATGEPISLLSDRLSQKINDLNDRIQGSSLWRNDRLRRSVLGRACPAVLIALVGLDAVIDRVPDSYLQAIFGAHLASRYVYSYGLSASEVDFVEMLQTYR